MSSKIVAFIPAREGSIRLPGKNKKLLFGKPLFAWSVELALSIRYIDKIIVSSDDPDILESCLNLYGNHEKLEVVRRPKELAQNNTPLFKVLEHLKDNGSLKGTEAIVFLQPTSPLRISEDVKKAILMFIFNGEGVIPITKINKYYYKRCGTVFVDKFYEIIANRDIREGQFILIPKERALDIDTLEDFMTAGLLMRRRLDKNE